MNNIQTLFLALTMGPLAAQAGGAKQPTEPFKKVTDIRTVMVHHKKNEFAAWPANHGLWTWNGGREMLAGFTLGEYVEQKGHKIGARRDVLARSMDGGLTWSLLSPDNYVDPQAVATAPTKPISFAAPDFVMRVVMGTETLPPCFYYSYNRGSTWSGPWLFTGLETMKELGGMTTITPRTDYQVLGEQECLLFFSATKKPFEDKTFVIKTRDGGLSFSFVSWIVPPSDPYRGVMPQTVALGKQELLSALRRRDKPGRPTDCWIDAYYSPDAGKSWSFRSRVANTGEGNSNGNPPAMTKLPDGRLLVVYGNRSLRMMLCRCSADGGRSWGEEIILRDDFLNKEHDFSDFGYPRVTVRKDGKIVALYYFATNERYEQHIACSVFSLDNLVDVKLKPSINAP